MGENSGLTIIIIAALGLGAYFLLSRSKTPIADLIIPPGAINPDSFTLPIDPQATPAEPFKPSWRAVEGNDPYVIAGMVAGTPCKKLGALQWGLHPECWINQDGNTWKI